MAEKLDPLDEVEKQFPEKFASEDEIFSQFTGVIESLLLQPAVNRSIWSML